MDASEMKAARAQLILRRNELMKGLRSQREVWTEFHRVCHGIADLDEKLGEDSSVGRALSWLRPPDRDFGGGRR
jgi:hypothetical protein